MNALLPLTSSGTEEIPPHDDRAYIEAATEKLYQRYREHLAIKGERAVIPMDLRGELFSILEVCRQMAIPAPWAAVILAGSFLGIELHHLARISSKADRDPRGAKTKDPNAKHKARAMDAEHIEAHGELMSGRQLAKAVGVSESALRAWRADPNWPGGAQER